MDCHREVLRGINLKLFDQVLQWVEESFSAVRSIPKPCHTEVQQPYPLLTDVICRRIPTAFVLTNEYYVSNVKVCRLQCEELHYLWAKTLFFLQKMPSLLMTSQHFRI
jgi:origin recognition complex subunit 3